MTSSIYNSSDIAVSIAVELCKYHPYYLLADTIWRIGALLCVLIGMPGHIIVVIIMLNKRNRKQPVCLYFATIALFEFIYLISRFHRKQIFLLKPIAVLYYVRVLILVHFFQYYLTIKRNSSVTIEIKA